MITKEINYVIIITLILYLIINNIIMVLKMQVKVKDKLIAILGASILVIASIGIYLWQSNDREIENTIGIEDLYNICGVFSFIPNAITVTDSSPYYALAATPIAINYDEKGSQNLAPLYIKDMNNPSTAIIRAEEQIGIYSDLVIDDSDDVEKTSLKLASKYWKNTDAVLLIHKNQSGYNLGVAATPIASYLSIPVIIAEKLNDQVKETLKNLDVKYSIVCGNIEGYGKVLKLNNINDVLNASTSLIRNKFGSLDYLVITNPIDIYEPKVLDTKTYSTGPVTLSAISSLNLPNTLKTILSNKKSSSKANEDAGSTKKSMQLYVGEFTIPEDYKYALVKFEGINHNLEGVDLFGDNVQFFVDGITSGYTYSSPSEYDSNGNVIKDSYYSETVVCGKGGDKCKITASPYWAVKKKGEVEVNVVIEKLSNPLYPMMKGLSSISSYLAAYRQGIVLAKPEFAFVLDEQLLDQNEEKYSGAYMSRYNKNLREPSNKHIYDNVHIPINKLLAQLADISEENTRDLTKYYKENPIYICLVGGATVLPQYVYDSVVLPSGTASDVIYGNVDPVKYDWSNCAKDAYSRYPYQENIIGRITGWDIQDASALIARTAYYNKIISQLEQWKDSAAVLTGCGTDFAKPKILMGIVNSLGLNQHVVEGYEEPLRWPTGCSEMSAEALQKLSLEPMGFTVDRLKYLESSWDGLSDDAIKQIKRANIINLLLTSKTQLKLFFGEDHVRGKEAHENSNFIFLHGHGAPDQINLGNEGLAGLGLGYVILPWILQVLTHVFKYGPSSSIAKGIFNCRSVEQANLGPSFIWFETCLAAWIDGRHPQTCLSQSYLHAGANAIIISTTPSNVPGGYLEPYTPYTSILGTIPAYIKAKLDAKKGIYPEHHFGEKLYADLLEDMQEHDSTIGSALRESRNKYLEEDADWDMYWTPPLKKLGDALFKKRDVEKDNFIEHKYVNYQEFLLYGDPAFNPYEPANLG